MRAMFKRSASRSRGENRGLADAVDEDAPTNSQGPFATIDTDAKAVHKYEFLFSGMRREVTLSHANSVWYVTLDSEVVATKKHSNTPLRTFRTSAEFSIPDLVSPSVASGTVTMEWIPRSMKWQYTLFASDVIVPPCWSKGSGLRRGVDPPEIGYGFAMTEAPRQAPEIGWGYPMTEAPQQPLELEQIATTIASF